MDNKTKTKKDYIKISRAELQRILADVEFIAALRPATVVCDGDYAWHLGQANGRARCVAITIEAHLDGEGI